MEEDDDIERLSRDDVHDLQVIGTFSTNVEATQVVELLEEIDIPSVIQPRSMGGILTPAMGLVQVVVPRLLAEKAVRAIAKSKGIEIPEVSPRVAKPQRGLFQIRLASLFVTMLVASVMMMLNLKPNANGEQGWPREATGHFGGSLIYHADAVVVDTFVCFALIVGAGAVCELLLRSRDRALAVEQNRPNG